MNRLIIIMLVACLSITACGRQKLTQIPQPQQEKQAETPQATVPVSSSKWTAMKWTFGVLAVASLSVALGWNWKEKEYYRAKSDMNAKRLNAVETWNRDPQIEVNPGDVDAIYEYAFEATNDFVWKCKRDEFEDLVKARDRICHFMGHDRALAYDTRQYNSNHIIPKSIRVYPNCSDRLWKFKHDASGWMLGIIERLMSRD